METASKRFNVNVTGRVQDARELGRKLDNSIELLGDIQGNTSTLHDIKGILKDIAEKS